jgi:hypothetical protein
VAPSGPRDQSGQASLEWLGVVLVISLAFAAMVAAGISVPGSDLARALAGKLVCVVDLGADCDEKASVLIGTYGSELAERVAEHTPLLEYEEGMRVLPVDWRECRENSCATGASSGQVAESETGHPVTLFSHVIDCRDPGRPAPGGADCSGDAAGHLYLQYWAYYPDSRTAPWDGDLFGNRGWHESDWESFQVRIAPDGTVEERASSHHGYNGDSGDPINDTGWFGGKSAWTEPTGRYWISAGSHAGRVGDLPPGRHVTHPSARVRQPHRLTRPRDVRVVPLESIHSEWDDYIGSKEHLPAWLKDVYLDPEATGTSG